MPGVPSHLRNRNGFQAGGAVQRRPCALSAPILGGSESPSIPHIHPLRPKADKIRPCPDQYPIRSARPRRARAEFLEKSRRLLVWGPSQMAIGTPTRLFKERSRDSRKVLCLAPPAYASLPASSLKPESPLGPRWPSTGRRGRTPQALAV